MHLEDCISINYLDVYWCSGISVDEYVVYEKKNTELYMTPLTVRFLGSPPKGLEIDETYVAWNQVPDSLIKFKICE